jgi:hypothetical protein
MLLFWQVSRLLCFCFLQLGRWMLSLLLSTTLTSRTAGFHVLINSLTWSNKKIQNLQSDVDQSRHVHQHAYSATGLDNQKSKFHTRRENKFITIKVLRTRELHHQGFTHTRIARLDTLPMVLRLS